MKRSTTCVLLVLTTATILPAQIAHADGASLAKKARALQTTASSTPPSLVYSLAGDTRSEIDELDIMTGATTKLAGSQGDLYAQAWSANTSRVYYSHTFGSGTVPDVQEVDSVPEAGGAPSATVAGADDFDISSDGTTFVYSAAGQIYKVAASGGAPTQLTGAGGFKPRFSRDGTRFVFTRVVGDNCDVYTLGTDGTGLKRITAAANDDMSGAFSPNGQRLVFTRESANGDPAVYSVGTDGKNLRLVARDAADPDWATNGWLAYLAIDDRGTLQIAVRSPGVPGVEDLLTDNGLDATSVRFRR